MSTPQEETGRQSRYVSAADPKNHRKVLELIAKLLGGDTQDAADLRQEVFLRWLSGSGTDQAREPLNYLCGIAKNVVNDRRRRDGRSPVVFDSDLADVKDIAPAANQTPEELVLQDQLIAALNKLPKRLLQVIQKTHLEQLTYEEAAQALGISVHTVKVNVAEALGRVRELLRTTSERKQDGQP